MHHEGLLLLLGTSAAIAVGHTAVGVDHYLPFIVLGKAESWSLRRTLAWTAICGAGHVLTSVGIGLLAIALGWAAGSLAVVQAVRGDVAAYLLIAFGAGYMLWDLIARRRGREHVHVHVHADGTVHSHAHRHAAPAHTHDDLGHAVGHRRSFWALFILFVLGPCEPLVPLLLAPSLQHDLGAAVLLVGLFATATIGTMLLLVTIGHLGLGLLPLGALERHRHALAGLAILLSGVAIQVFGI